MTTTHHELSRAEHEFRRRRRAVVFRLREYLSRYAFGETLPTAGALADALDVEARFIGPALTHLDTEGALVYRGGNRGSGQSYRLGPGEQHPDDVAFDRDIRQKIANGHYQQGSPLPTQILADRHGLETGQLPRASRQLIKDRLIASREEGPLGPGLYVL